MAPAHSAREENGRGSVAHSPCLLSFVRVAID